MSAQLTFDTESLRSGGADISSAGNDLQAKFESLAGSAPAWGADDISGLCQMVYEAIVDVVRESTGGVAQSWADHSEKLQVAAKIFDQTEADNAAASTSIQAV